jgi:predicted amidohydrolase
MSTGRIAVATCQFAETFDPRANAAAVIGYMERASAAGAEVAHFHEAALSGYLAREGAPPPGRVDWPAVRAAAEEVCEAAGRLGLWVVVGSAHPLTGANKPTNCLYLIGPDGRLRDRYDKRFCTAGDLEIYTPGDHFVTFDLNGVTCSLLICFDLRFPELYRELCRLGVQAVFQSFHNGYCDGPGIHGKIMRQTVQAHAGINALWFSMTNSAGPHCRWPSVFIQPDGEIAASLKLDEPGMMVNTIDTTRRYYDPSRPFRDAAMRGILHSGQVVDDPRQRDRTSL